MNRKITETESETELVQLKNHYTFVELTGRAVASRRQTPGVATAVVWKDDLLVPTPPTRTRALQYIHSSPMTLYPGRPDADFTRGCSNRCLCQSREDAGR